MNLYLDLQVTRSKIKKLSKGSISGFHVGFEGSPCREPVLNLKTAEEQPDIVDQYIKKELEAGKIEGAFEHVHFETHQMSPVGVVPIKEPGNVRIIHHLSFPDGIYSFYTTSYTVVLKMPLDLLKRLM